MQVCQMLLPIGLRSQSQCFQEAMLTPVHVQVGEEKFPSAVPFLPPLTDATMTQYFRFYTAAVAIIVVFGGLLSPILEVKLGLGGDSSLSSLARLAAPATAGTCQ